MKSMSIKAKVILSVSLCLAIGAAALIGLVRHSYNRNVAIVAQNALNAARKSYENLKEDRGKSFAAATAVITNVDAIRQLFLARDRAALQEYTKPAFEELKKQGVIHLLYVDDKYNVVLRMHKPQAFGDDARVGSFVKKATQTQTMVMGTDLVAIGFAIGSCRPYHDRDGKVIGYVIAGGTLDNFLESMKNQTADDYEMVGIKQLMNESLYHKTQQQQGLKDKWSQFRDVMVLSATNDANLNANYESEMGSVPPEGKLLGEAKIGDKVYIRGVFPMINALGKTTGSIFVRHDITELYSGMHNVQTFAVAAIVGLMLIISIVIARILNQLVFTRLRRTMDTATRVVGGEFERQIVPVSDDEVGKLESLLEQFRALFVNVVNDLSAQQSQQATKE